MTQFILWCLVGFISCDLIYRALPTSTSIEITSIELRFNKDGDCVSIVKDGETIDPDSMKGRWLALRHKGTLR